MNILNWIASRSCYLFPLVVFLLFIAILGREAFASDLEREKRMAAEIVDAILDGDPVMLEAEGVEFLSIYTEAMEEPVKGNVIIMHGRGYHPDWAEVANPLRVGLAEQGWNTLSLQMPVLEKDAKYFDYVPIFEEAIPRIDAGLAYLAEQNDLPVVMIAHSCGAHMAMEWVQNKGDEAIDAYVGIGMGATDYGQPMLEPFPLADMSVPVLDIYGADEFPAVLKMAPERLGQIQEAGNPLSTQIVAPDADHYFRDRGRNLLELVSGWLDTLVASPEWGK
jgi:hypothetical protein